ncbi:unnamed protein product [Tenebrio molitor]|nr:unnamed protein product [Tenebrio molitor]
MKMSNSDCAFAAGGFSTLITTLKRVSSKSTPKRKHNTPDNVPFVSLSDDKSYQLRFDNSGKLLCSLRK